MVNVDLRNKNIFLDTSPIIYFIEGNSTFQDKLKQIFDLNERGDLMFITSSITLLEVLVKPLKLGENQLADSYKNILMNSSGIELVEISNSIAVKAAGLRSKYSLKTPDAIQLAIAIEYNTDYFLTNDLRLKSVNEVRSLTLSDL